MSPRPSDQGPLSIGYQKKRSVQKQEEGDIRKPKGATFARTAVVQFPFRGTVCVCASAENPSEQKEQNKIQERVCMCGESSRPERAEQKFQNELIKVTVLAPDLIQNRSFMATLPLQHMTSIQTAI
eukprot:3780662-Amphidinium_carterae.1